MISNVGFALGKAETLAIVGKNGMGKTSRLKAIVGFLPAWRGRVKLAGKDVARIAPHLKRKMGLVYVPQEHALFQDLSVRDNLRLGVLTDGDMSARFEQVGGWSPVLTKRLSQRAGTLSGGEQKMLIVARADGEARRAAARRGHGRSAAVRRRPAVRGAGARPARDRHLP